METRQRQALVIGTPNELEQAMLATLRPHYHVRVERSATTVYQYMAHVVPEFVMFTSQPAESSALHFFRQLRWYRQVCVIVCAERELLGFVGRRHERRIVAPKSGEGLQRIVGWSAARAKDDVMLHHSKTRRGGLRV